MGNNKQIAKNTLLLYFRMLFTMGVSLYTSRIVLNTLGIVDYGLYNVVGGVVTMFTFLNGAMASSTQRFLNYEIGKGNTHKLKSVFSSSIFIHIIIAFIIIILAETIGLYFLYNKLVIPTGRFNAAFWVYQLSIFSCVIMLLSAPYNATIIAHEKMNAFAYISILEVSLKLIIVYLLTISTFDKLILYAILLLTVQILIRLIYQIYCNLNFQETKIKWEIDQKTLKDIGNFASWNLLGSMALVGVTQGVNIILNLFFGPTVNAARAVAVQVQAAINGFSTNFQTAVNPQITKSYASNDLKYTHSLIIGSSKFSFFVLYFLSLPILIETNYVLSIWLGKYPEHTALFIRIILLISMIDATSNALVTAINATGRIKIYQVIIGIILLMVVPISYTILKLGIIAPEIVFLVHLIINFIALFIRLLFAQKLISLNIKEYVSKVYLKIILVIFCSLPLPLLLHILMEKSLFRLLIIIFTSLICNTVIIYYIGLRNNERQMVVNNIKNKIKKQKK